MKLGAYDLESEIGRGGMGTVWKARSQEGQAVAVKLLLSAKRDSIQRFEREVRLLSSLNESGGFVPLLSAGEGPRGPYIVMPFLEGGTLRSRLARGPLGIDETVAIGRALARAVGRAHEAGIVHRDLKPENVIFTRDGRPLVADLGLAKHFLKDASGASVSLSVAGELRGTAGYMAPEQAKDAKSAQAPADVFALGAMLYECLAGSPPFEGANVVEVLLKVVEGDVPPLRPSRPEMPAWLERVVLRALARDPAARFPDGRALAAALERGGRQGARRALLAGLVVLALAGGAAIFALASSHGESEPSPSPATTNAPPATSVSSARQTEARKAAQDAVAHALRCDFDRALALATRAIELDPKLALGWAVRGEARLHRREVEAGYQDAVRACELDPKLPWALLARGNARVRRGDLPGGLADLERSVAIDPRFACGWLDRGCTLYEKGDVDGAVASIDKALAIDPDFPLGRVEKAQMLHAKGDPEGAIALLDRIIESMPDFATAWEDRAEARLSKRDYPRILEDAKRAVELDPKSAKAWWLRGTAKYGLGEVDGALADLDRAIELEPRFAIALDFRAAVRAKKGDPDAWSDLDRAIEFAPQNKQLLFERGRMRFGRGDFAGAASDLERVTEIDPKDAEAWTGRAAALVRSPQPHGAIDCATRALELKPDSGEALVARGTGFIMRGDPDRALADLDRAVALDPTAPRLILRGRARAMKKDQDGAIADYSRAIELAPTAGEAWAARGCARAESGDAKGAITDLERSLELLPEGSPRAAEARAKLQEVRSAGR